MSFKLGKVSLKNIDNISPYLKMIVKRAIDLTTVDFGIIHNGGYRTEEMQKEIFEAGNTKCDGVVKKSYHQTGLAVDLVPYIDGRYTWSNKLAFIEIYKAFLRAENELKDKGYIPENVYFHHGIFWNWKDIDNDGEITISDKLGWDAAHHEQRTKKQKI
ncbi:MAG: hypothetical protein JXA68_07120 [Ignavibacteriales bacterium]|nr:hypothetical protein [Ignavibacteriales bacterium]